VAKKLYPIKRKLGEKMKNLLIIIISSLLILSLYGVPKNDDLIDEIQILVTRENADGLSEKDFENPDIVEIIEYMITEKILLRAKQAFINQGVADDTDVSISSESWCLTLKNRNFIVVKVNLENIVQSTIIIGIIDDVLIKITGNRTGSLPVPHSYGPCADKAEEIFGVKFSK
jgi:hypothetical protein